MTAQDTLSQWLEQSARVRARMLEGGGKPGIAHPDQTTGMTGLDILQAMLAGEVPYSNSH